MYSILITHYVLDMVLSRFYAITSYNNTLVPVGYNCPSLLYYLLNSTITRRYNKHYIVCRKNNRPPARIIRMPSSSRPVYLARPNTVQYTAMITAYRNFRLGVILRVKFLITRNCNLQPTYF